MFSIVISVFSLLLAATSAFYSRGAVKQSRRQNELTRLSALLDLKKSHLDEMQKQQMLSKDWGENDSFTNACKKAYLDAQKKYDEVNSEINQLHEKIVRDEV